MQLADNLSTLHLSNMVSKKWVSVHKCQNSQSPPSRQCHQPDSVSRDPSQQF